MAAPSDSPIPLFPKRWQGKTLGQSWPSSHACLLCQVRASPEPGQAAAITLSVIKPTESPITPQAMPTTEPTAAGCCGSARAIWELHYMAPKAGPVLLLQGPWAHLNPGSAVWLPSGHLLHADCTGVKQPVLRSARAGWCAAAKSLGLWGRTEGKAQGSAACFLHHIYPHPYCPLLTPKK